MLNGNEWHQLQGEFLGDTQTLMHRADECLSHLELISDDRDAMECLLATLQQLAGKADDAGIPTICGFARQIRYLLYFTSAAGNMAPEALLSLRRCLSLLSWQLELIDPTTGLLPLDESEQHDLLEQFACHCGVGKAQGSHACTPGWSANNARPDAHAAERVDQAQAR